MNENDNDSPDVSLSEQIAQLKTQLDSLREAVFDAILEYDDIRLQQNPIIEAEYVTRIGCYELEAYKTDIAARRAKRKYTLMVQARNLGDEPHAESIESQLDSELEEWTLKAQTLFQHQADLLVWRKCARPLSEGESKELKHLYRTICKRLHPDVCPNPTEDVSRLFISAQSAYKAGDLEMLRAIEITTCDINTGDADQPSDELDSRNEDACLSRLDELSIDLALAEALHETYQIRIAEMKDSFPYNMIGLLSDDGEVRKRVDTLKIDIEHNKDVRLAYEKRIREEFGG